MNRLESLVAMQDKTIEQLHAELFRQQQDFSKLQLRMQALEQKVANLAPTDSIGGNERPPHY